MKKTIIASVAAIILFIIMCFLAFGNKTPEEKAIKLAFNDLNNSINSSESITINDCRAFNYSLDEKYDPTMDLKYEGYKLEIFVYFDYTIMSRGNKIDSDRIIYACDEKGDIIQSCSYKEYRRISGTQGLPENDRLLIEYWLGLETFNINTGNIEIVDRYHRYSYDDIKKL